jgi:hypothetical protein
MFEGDIMRALSILTAVALAVAGLAAVSVTVPGLESPALAQNAKQSRKPRLQRSTVPRSTGFEHQQCSVQSPCSTRNQW